MIAFWLMPAEAENCTLSSIIDRLAHQYDAPVFAPHVTLHGGDIDPRHALNCLHMLPVSGALQLDVDAICSSPAFTKSVYVQFKRSAAAITLSAAIAEAPGCGGDYVFDPHLSLIYKAVSDTEKQKIVSSVAMQLDTLTFDKVRVISGPARTESRADVEAWRTLAEKSIPTIRITT